jgi:hypothetical protein
MHKFVAAIIVFFVSYAHAQETVWLWITYSQWERLAPEQKVFYMAGAFDSLMGVSSNEKGVKMALHYSKCISDSGMKLREFTDRVAAYAESHPKLQGGTVQGAMINYLVELCGASTQ